MYSNTTTFPKTRASTRISVRKFSLSETGRYQAQVNRPFDTFIDQGSLEALATRVHDNTSAYTTASTIAGTVGGILQPSAQHMGVVNLPNGWNEKRLRFILEVEVESATGLKYIDYFQGFSDYMGIGDSMNNYIDPNMVFHINTHTSVMVVNEQTPMGVVAREQIKGSNHIINGKLVTANQGMEQSKLIRPQDVFNSIQAYAIADTNYGYGDGAAVNDTRTLMQGRSNTSKRSNSTATNYLASIVDSYSQGLTTSDMGVGTEDVYARSREYTLDPFCNDIPFIRALSNITSIPGTTSFTMANLISIDPNASNVTSATRQSATSRVSLPEEGMSNYWTGQDMETIMASTLSVAVPTIVSELLFARIAFSVTNGTTNGQVHMEIDPSSVVAMTSADLSRHFNIFQRRLEREVLFDLSYQNQISYAISMDTTWAGDTFIRISVNGGPTIDFVSPTFSDSLLVPTYTANPEHHRHLVHDMQNLIEKTGINQQSYGVNTMI